MNFFEKPKIMTYAIIILFLLNFGTIAFIWLHKPPHPEHEFMQHELPPPHDNEKPADFLIHELNLNTQQQSDFEKLRKEHQDAMKQSFDDMKKNKDELFGYLSKGQGDSVKVNQLADNIARSQKQIELATFSHFQKVRAICDENQKKKFDEIIGDALKMMAGSPPPDEHKGPPPPPHR